MLKVGGGKQKRAAFSDSIMSACLVLASTLTQRDKTADRHTVESYTLHSICRKYSRENLYKVGLTGY